MGSGWNRAYFLVTGANSMALVYVLALPND